ncbi:CopG family transcriptional regulator [Thiospirochaeta perfilievii]|uniref:CopG family transcriptional regulator n=1 Tax=Thiospirochaeta perfilievii TaxID=252967 RepID=A0A5C1QCS4_9SPIO|nr:CopG family transcriptional regulator [Thiospirochaeta perfilievii]QEN05351.1 CopG family transcriptional regulator [Thiospirochaeta perfilievii]
MAKTVTMRIDDNTYNLIKNAATGERRSISNFIEYATMAYLAEESFISDKEMDEILNDKDLLVNLKNGNEEIESGKYRIIE